MENIFCYHLYVAYWCNVKVRYLVNRIFYIDYNYWFLLQELGNYSRIQEDTYPQNNAAVNHTSFSDPFHISADRKWGWKGENVGRSPKCYQRSMLSKWELFLLSTILLDDILIFFRLECMWVFFARSHMAYFWQSINFNGAPNELECARKHMVLQCHAFWGPWMPWYLTDVGVPADSSTVPHCNWCEQVPQVHTECKNE